MLKVEAPIPAGAGWQEVAEALQTRLDADDRHRRDAQGRTAAERFLEDRDASRPLPATRLGARKVARVTVSRTASVQVEGAWYSVPWTWKHLDATAHVAPTAVTITCRGQRTVKPRQQFVQRAVAHRDYLPELASKPQAGRQVALELLAELGEPFGRPWELLVQAHGQEAARVLARFVGAIHEHGEEPVRQAVLAPMQAGRTDLLSLAALMTPRRIDCVPIPEALASHGIEVARAADCDLILGDWA